MILAAFGLGGVLAGRSAGRGVDRFGRVPTTLAGAVSIVSAARFAGSAAAPLIWLPAFHVHPRASFLAPAALVCATVVLVASLQRRPGAVPARA